MGNTVDRCAAGDVNAAAQIYRDYYARVKGFLRKRGEGAEDAEDVAQDALLAGLEGLKKGQQPVQLTRWLMGIARHKLARRMRPTKPIPDLREPHPTAPHSYCRRNLSRSCAIPSMACPTGTGRCWSSPTGKARRERKSPGS